MNPNPRESAKLLASTLLLLLAVTFLIMKVVIPSTGHMTHGFIGYYTASRLLLEGKFGPQIYDDDWFTRQVHAIVKQPIDEIMTPTLPTVSLLALPFAWLSPQTARDSWIWFNLLALIATLSLLAVTLSLANQKGRCRQSHASETQNARRVAGRFQLSKTGPGLATFPELSWGVGMIALLLLFPPLAPNFYLGQSFIIFLGLLTLTLYGLVNRQHGLAGLSLGLAFILKTMGLSLWLLLLVQRRWQPLAWGVGVIIGVTLLSLPWIGLATWLAYLQIAWNFAGSPTVAVTAYQTTAGFFSHLFRFDPIWNPQPIMHLPVLAASLTLLVTVAATAVTLWRGRDASIPHFFAALIPLGTILLPKAEEYHFTLLLIPAVILLNDLVQHPRAGGFFSADGLLLGIALFLLVVPFQYDDLSLSVGWLALLAYPRLYGAWLMWWVSLRRMRAAGMENYG